MGKYLLMYCIESGRIKLAISSVLEMFEFKYKYTIAVNQD